MTVNTIPLHTLRLVERVLGGYCERICPPGARQTVVLGYRLDADRVTVHEIRTFCGVPGAHRHVDVAQLRYARSGQWRLFYADAAMRWRRYTPRPVGRSFVELLRAIDADPHGLFWCRVNGKSLRWCSSRGRCAGCDERYCRILDGRILDGDPGERGRVIAVEPALRARSAAS